MNISFIYLSNNLFGFLSPYDTVILYSIVWWH